MAKTLSPQELIDNLEAWVKRYREEEVWSLHNSLYLLILAQWKSVNRFNPDTATDEDKRQYELYWEEMNKWYRSFEQYENEIFGSMPVSAGDQSRFFPDTMASLQERIMNKVPRAQQTKVVGFNNFLNILNVSLVDIAQINFAQLSRIDTSLLIDYWMCLEDAVAQY
ncbi:hypothetical protein AALA17_02180 [Lactobacillaceae bacterium 24-114]